MKSRVPVIEGLEARVLLSETPIVVTTFDDVVDEFDDLTSLREAITQAAAADSGDDVIQLPTGWYGLNEQLTIDDASGSLSILGLDGLATLDAQGNGRVMEILPGSNVQLTLLGITGGSTTELGGGVYNAGTLMLEACEVYGNQAGDGGGIYNGYSGMLSVNSSTIAGNHAGGNEYLNNYGGGIYNGGQAAILNSTISGNDAAGGGGVYNGYMYQAAIIQCTVYDNFAINLGGGVFNDGLIPLDNSIVAGNYITDLSPSDLEDGGAGVFLGSLPDSGPRNNLIGWLPEGHYIVNGENGNIVGVDPMLQPLANYGGPTRAHAIDTTSPAWNAGSDAVAENAGLEFDQRGYERFVGTVDIGAFEFLPAVTATIPQVDTEDVGDPNGDDPGQITVEFNGPIDSAAVADPLNYDLRRDTDGDGDFADEVPIAVSVITDDGQAVYLDTGGSLLPGEYELQLNGNAGATQVVRLSQTPTTSEMGGGMEISGDWVLWGVDSGADDLTWYVWDGSATRQVPAGGFVWDSIHLVDDGVAWCERIDYPTNEVGDLFFWDGQSAPVLVGTNVLVAYGADGERGWREEDGLFAWINGLDGHVYVSEVGGTPVCVSETPTSVLNIRGFELSNGSVLWGDDLLGDGAYSWCVWDGSAVFDVPASENVFSAHLATGGVGWVEETSWQGTGDLYFWDMQSDPTVVGADVWGTVITTEELRGWVEDDGLFAWGGLDEHVYVCELGGDPVLVSQTTTDLSGGIWISGDRVLWGGSSDGSFSWNMWDGNSTYDVPMNGPYSGPVHLVDGGVAWSELDPEMLWTNLYFWGAQSDPLVMATDIKYDALGWPWAEDAGRYVWTSAPDSPGGDGHVYTAFLAGGLFDVNGILLDGDSDGQTGGNWVGEFTIHPADIDVSVGLGQDIHIADFGASLPTAQVTKLFTLHNDGQDNLTVTDILLPEGAFDFWWVDEANAGLEEWVLAPDEALQFVVAFRPDGFGVYNNTLTILSDDADEPVYQIDLTGEGVNALPYYEVWGGNSDYTGQMDNWWEQMFRLNELDYVRLGASNAEFAPTEFEGVYDYYIITTRARVQVDAVYDNGIYGYSRGDGNADQFGNISELDGLYTTIGYQGTQYAYCGFMVVQNPGGQWDGMTVHTGRIDLPLHVNISQEVSYDGLADPRDYEHWVGVWDQGWSTAVRFQAPSGQWYDMWRDQDGNWDWEYSNDSFTTVEDMVAEFGSGWYTVEATSQWGLTTTQICFADADGESELPWPTQRPQAQSIAHGATGVPTDTQFTWAAVNDPNVDGVNSWIDNANGNSVYSYWTDDTSQTSFGQIGLSQDSNYVWDLSFQSNNYGVNADGYGFHVGRSVRDSVVFRTEGEGGEVQPDLMIANLFYTPGVYQPGDVLADVDAIFGNIGEGNAIGFTGGDYPQPIWNEVRLSKDKVWGNADDVTIFQFSDSYWLGGEMNYPEGEPYGPGPYGWPQIPEGTPEGQYYVGFRMDVNNVIAESNEANNLWWSASADIQVGLPHQPQTYVLCVGVRNQAVKFAGDIAAQRVHDAFAGMNNVVSNQLVLYNVNQAGNRQNLINRLNALGAILQPDDTFILYIAAQACTTISGDETPVDTQWNTAQGHWDERRQTTGDEYLYLSAVDAVVGGVDRNYLSDDDFAALFLGTAWASVDKVFILDTPYAGGFIGTPGGDDSGDLSQLAKVCVYAAAGEGDFAFMTTEPAYNNLGVNRMGTAMVTPIIAQRQENHFDVKTVFQQVGEPQSLLRDFDGQTYFMAQGGIPQDQVQGLNDGGGLALFSLAAAVDLQVVLDASVRYVTYTDADGSVVTVSLRGAAGQLTFQGAGLWSETVRGVTYVYGQDVRLDAVQIDESTLRSSLAMTVRGGDGLATVGQVVGADPIGLLSLAQVDIVGAGINLSDDGYALRTYLHDVADGASIVMAGQGATRGVVIVAARMGDVTVNLASPLASLTAWEWTAGSLTAPWIGSLSISSPRGAGASGDFGADVTITGQDARGWSLTKAYVTGNVAGSTWNIAGNINLLNVGGWLDASQIRTPGDINLAVFGAMRDSAVFAGVRMDYDTDLDGDGVLDLPGLDDLLADRASRIGRLLITGIRGLAVQDWMVNSNIAAHRFGLVSLLSPRLNNNQGLGGATPQFGVLAGQNGIARLWMVLNGRRYVWINHAWVAAVDAQDFTVVDQA